MANFQKELRVECHVLIITEILYNIPDKLPEYIFRIFPRKKNPKYFFFVLVLRQTNVRIFGNNTGNYVRIIFWNFIKKY